MTLSTAEIEATRFHLGWGNVGLGALPYTDDGYWSIFDQIVSPYLGTGTETSSTTAVTANSTAAVTPALMTGILVYGQLVVGVADQAEIVVVSAVSATTFTAYFSKAHAATGYPITTMCGLARLRMLLWQADTAWQAIQAQSVASTSGLKSVDKGDIVWKDDVGGANAALQGRKSHYRTIVQSISSLVRVPIRGRSDAKRVTLEAY